jgi:hypothetical protein
MNHKSQRNDKIQNLLSELSLDEHNEDEKDVINETEVVEHQINNQTINESDNSTQILDVDRYRIDFTTNDDDNFDDFTFSNSKQNRISTSKLNASENLSPTKPLKVNNVEDNKFLDFDCPVNGDGGSHNGNNEEYIEQISVLKENEKHNLQRIRYLEDEISKFQ